MKLDVADRSLLAINKIRYNAINSQELTMRLKQKILILCGFQDFFFFERKPYSILQKF